MKRIKNQSFFPILVLLLTGIFAALGCHSNKTGEAATMQEEAPNHDEEEEGLMLTAAQMKAVDIRMDTISMKNMHTVVRASGQLAVPPQNKADVNVLMGGIIQKILVQEGQVVHKGQVLARLENPDFIKLQKDYLTTKRNFVFVTEERQRQEELSEANAGTGKNRQQAEANFQSEKAKIIALQKQLQLLGISPTSVENGNITGMVMVCAPINGTIGHINVNTGTYATTDKPLMEIIDNSKVHADLIVFEKDLFKVKAGQKVRFVLTNQDNQELEGKIYGINKSFEDETKGIIVHVTIQNAGQEHLIPGMYVTGLIDVGDQVVPALPVDAVVRTDEKDYIYVAEKSHDHKGMTSFRKVEVATGVKELGAIQIMAFEQLPKGTQVVTKGAFYLLSSEKPAGEHGH